MKPIPEVNIPSVTSLRNDDESRYDWNHSLTEPLFNSQEKQRMCFIRQRYLECLGHYSMIVQGYVPNLEPLFTSRPNVLRRHPVTAIRSCFNVSNRSHRITPITFDNPSTYADFNYESPLNAADPAGFEMQNQDQLQEVEVSPETTAAHTRQRGFFGAGSMKSSIFNLTSATLGAGALSIPFAIASTGAIFGVVSLALVALCSAYATSLIVHICNYTELTTFEEIALNAGGRRFAIFVEVCIITYCFGVAVGYLISIGDIVEAITLNAAEISPNSIWSAFLSNKRFILVGVTFLVLLPLCLMDNISSLRFTSLLGVSAILFLASVVSYQFFQMGWSADVADIANLLYPKSIVSSISAMSIIIFAFSCQSNVPGIYCELENPDTRRMTKVSIRSALLCFVTYTAIGVFGFFSWGHSTKANIMRNYIHLLQHNFTIPTSFVGMGVAVICAYPMNVFPCRFATEMLISWNNTQPAQRRIRLMITSTIVLISLLVALVAPSISFVFQIVGCTAGSFVAFIFPAHFYITLLPGSIQHLNKFGASCLLLFGITVAILGTIESVYELCKPN